MFNSITVEKLRPRIKKAVKELLECASKNQKNPNDIVLFLMNGHFDSRLLNIPRFAGHMLSPGERGLDDEYRMEFVIDYLRSADETLVSKVRPNEVDRHVRFTLHLELMIYSHFWETDVCLKDLKQLSNMISNQPYDWNNEIPERDKYEFIRDQIRGVFLDYRLDIGSIIKEAYHSQLRNAFAHGQYAFRGKDKIALLNYKGESHEIETISYEDWESRFLKTSILFYELIQQKIDLLLWFGENQPRLRVWMPSSTQVKSIATELIWHAPSRRYIFEKNSKG